MNMESAHQQEIKRVIGKAVLIDPFKVNDAIMKQYTIVQGVQIQWNSL
jgi:hypothetical protein